MTAKDVKRKLNAFCSAEVAKSSARFFKTGPGQYAEGDIFIGIKVPTLRIVSREFRDLPLEEIEALLKSPIHEERHLALMILVLQFAKCDDTYRTIVYDFYLHSTRFINNWDLVDCSAPQIVGGFLMKKPRDLLFQLTTSQSLWERRIAIVSTQQFIRHDDFADTLAISQRLLKDEEDLIHKAAGWMLREVGKRNSSVLVAFLEQHGPDMPRTMLRYAIERFQPDQRQYFLKMRNRLV